MSKTMNQVEQNYGITEKEMLVIIQAIKEWRKYLKGTQRKVKIVTDHKNLEYFKHAKITNRRQARWALEIQNIPYQIEYRKGKNNIGADALTRRKDQTTLEERKIFLNELSLEKAKEQGYHSRLNIVQVTEEEGKWKYKRKPIIETYEDKQRILYECHNDKIAGHPEVKKTLHKVKEVAFWDTMIRDVRKYVLECDTCQRERLNRKLGIGQEILRPEEI